MATSQKRSQNSTRRTSPTAEDLEKVREILFGEHLRELELEIETLRGDLARVKSELETRVSAERAEIDRLLAGIRQSVDDVRIASVSRSGISAMLGKLASEVGGGQTPRQGRAEAGASDG